MIYDEKIQNLTQQINIASREVIIQDRILGQHREKVAELQGRINMLVELQQEDQKIDEGVSIEVKKLDGKKIPEVRPKKPKKPNPKPGRKIERERFRYPDGLRNFCIKNIDKMKNQELVEAANEEFDLDMDYMRLMSYLKYNNIKRSKEVKKEPRVLPPEDDY